MDAALARAAAAALDESSTVDELVELTDAETAHGEPRPRMEIAPTPGIARVQVSLGPAAVFGAATSRSL
ncbi:hypothetical protein [Amycolatopsis albispora]|uniref:Uncharacterized protein n=1 Tax=Amycolatopsis albispora TaxID=1804986 RepID=A0A344L130_9PSEU|nr:hypothetical protein [Amycolatopsis albispora]AXB41754.1 hypothetical protein A4R43_03810 [Amycolatopsis albispora]